MLNHGGNVVSMRLPAGTPTREARGIILNALTALVPDGVLVGGTTRAFYRHRDQSELFQVCVNGATADALHALREDD